MSTLLRPTWKSWSGCSSNRMSVPRTISPDPGKSSTDSSLFIRSLVGLDREAAKWVFARFFANRTLSANQIEFINIIIDYLTEHGVMDPGMLYESTFADLSGTGPEGIYAPEQVDAIVNVLEIECWDFQAWSSLANSLIRSLDVPDISYRKDLWGLSWHLAGRPIEC